MNSPALCLIRRLRRCEHPGPRLPDIPHLFLFSACPVGALAVSVAAQTCGLGLFSVDQNQGTGQVFPQFGVSETGTEVWPLRPSIPRSSGEAPLPGSQVGGRVQSFSVSAVAAAAVSRGCSIPPPPPSGQLRGPPRTWHLSPEGGPCPCCGLACLGQAHPGYCPYCKFCCFGTLIVIAVPRGTSESQSRCVSPRGQETWGCLRTACHTVFPFL